MFRFIEMKSLIKNLPIVAAGIGLAVMSVSTVAAQDRVTDRIEPFKAIAAASQGTEQPSIPLQVVQVRQIRIQQTGFLAVSANGDARVTAVPVRITRQITMVRVSPVDQAALSRARISNIPEMGVTPRQGMQQAAYTPREAGFAPARATFSEERMTNDGPLFSMSQIMPQDEQDGRIEQAALATMDMIAQVRRGEERREWQSAQRTGFHPSKANGSLQHGLNWLGDLTGINK